MPIIINKCTPSRMGFIELFHEGVTMAKIQEKRFGIRELLGDKREQILKLAEKHGAKNVRVFGSVARGEATPESDVDFLVDWDYSRISAWGGIGLYTELENLLQRKVDITSEKELHWYIRDRVMKEAVML